MHREESGTNRATTATSPGKPEREARPETGGSSRSRNLPSSGFTGNGSAGGSLAAPVKAQAARGGERGNNQDGGSRRTSDVKNESNSKVTEAESKMAEREQKKAEANDAYVKGPASRSPIRREDSGALRQGEELVRERQTKRFVSQDDAERGQQKRRKGPHTVVEKNHVEAGELVRASERDRFLDQRTADSRAGHDGFEKGPQERPRDRVNLRGAERAVERESRPNERAQERLERDRGEDYPSDRHRDRSIENFGRERSSDRAPDRLFERGSERVREDRVKEDRVRQRYGDLPGEQPHPDDRFPMQNQPQSLPPPPPIPPNVVPRTVSVSRLRVEEALEGRPVRNVQRLSSPRPHEKLDKRRTDDGGGVVALEEPRKRRDDDTRNRKQRIEDRELQAIKVCGPSLPSYIGSSTRVLSRRTICQHEGSAYYLQAF